jgi:hypothetical protein
MYLSVELNKGFGTLKVILVSLGSLFFTIFLDVEQNSLKNPTMVASLDRWLLKYGDPRVKDYFLMQSPFPTMAISALYVFIVKVNRCE